MKKIIWHPKAKEDIQSFPKEIRHELGYLLYKLQKGDTLHMPLSRPMPSVSKGVYELRVRGSDGIYRAFYYLKYIEGVLVFHCFKKKSQKTTLGEIQLGSQRLKEFL